VSPKIKRQSCRILDAVSEASLPKKCHEKGIKFTQQGIAVEFTLLFGIVARIGDRRFGKRQAKSYSA
jgi:hypothetical protein